ncbi:MAG TPA: hypothetical protein VEB23_15780, partial [Ramlibacter sp.]|nr:hypothetical protein [Ramlibacter sp.]
TDTAGTLPTVDRLEIGSYASGLAHLNSHIKRVTYWPLKATATQLQAVTTSGPSAIGYDSGWRNACEFIYNDDPPANWGHQHDLPDAFDTTLVRYITDECLDPDNADGYLEFGQTVAAGGFQPSKNISYGLRDGVTELSSVEESPTTGKQFSEERERPAYADIALNHLTPAEGQHVMELVRHVGVTRDVIYILDPDDMAASQFYGGLGTLRELNALEYPQPLRRAVPFRWRKKG